MTNKYYPGCSLNDIFAKPAVKLWNRVGKKTYHEFYGTKILMEYNGYGYRTNEFSSTLGDYFLAAGDSQTEGIGLHHDQTYIAKLEKSLGLPCINLGLASAPASFVGHNISAWVTSWPTKPKFVIAQWPQGIVRMMQYMENHLTQFFNIHNANKLHGRILKQSHDNFSHWWLAAVINTNRLLSALDIPVINVCLAPSADLELVDDVLANYPDIKIHTDWPIDQRAYDRAHAGEECNTQWAEQILTIYKETINENTTR